MSKKFVVGFDGSEASKRALDFAIERAGLQDASVVVAHVLEWSPYSFLTPQELEERHKRRTEELERAKASVIDPVLKALKGGGVSLTSAIRYGQIADTLCDIAKDEAAGQIFVGRNGVGGVTARIFGSVAGTLIQISPVPCTVVP